eukprot:3726713-Rhodomonas_salina.1
MQRKATLRSAHTVGPRRQHASWLVWRATPSLLPPTLLACLQVGLATGWASYSFTLTTDSMSMPPGLASYSFTLATDSMSMPPGRASYSITSATYTTCNTQGLAKLQLHSCSDELRQHSYYNSTSLTMSTF